MFRNASSAGWHIAADCSSCSITGHQQVSTLRNGSCQEKHASSHSRTTRVSSVDRQHCEVRSRFHQEVRRRHSCTRFRRHIPWRGSVQDSSVCPSVARCTFGNRSGPGRPPHRCRTFSTGTCGNQEASSNTAASNRSIWGFSTGGTTTKRHHLVEDRSPGLAERHRSG